MKTFFKNTVVIQIYELFTNSLLQKRFPKYKMIQFDNTIPKYIPEESSITKLELKLINFLFTKEFYNKTSFLEEDKSQHFEYEEKLSTKMRVSLQI